MQCHPEYSLAWSNRTYDIQEIYHHKGENGKEEIEELVVKDLGPQDEHREVLRDVMRRFIVSMDDKD